MAPEIEVVASRGGRTLVGRLHPGTDLIRGLEAACDAHGVRFAAVSAAYGSLSSAAFKILQVPPGESHPRLMDHRIAGRVEFMGGQGLVCATPEGARETHLHGSVSDATGAVLGGHFVPDLNPVFNNMDLVIQELLDVELVRAHDPVTNTVEMQVRSVPARS